VTPDARRPVDSRVLLPDCSVHRLDETAPTTCDGIMATKPAPVAFGPYKFIWDGRGYVPDPASWPTDLPDSPPQVERLVQAAKRG
jgi:hypothetical protein